MVIAPILRAINKTISTGLGLAGEKYSNHKDRKLALTEQKQKGGEFDVHVHEIGDRSRSGDNIASDERIWALDEAAGLPSYNASEFQQQQYPGVERTVADLVHDVTTLREREADPIEFDTARIPYPIIIPQRRPGSKARGWARAYPPGLEAKGIDQDTFLGFLQSFETASQGDPWLRALYVAGNIVGLVPGHITLAVSLSVTIAAGTAIELQSRYKVNAFLDQMNQDVFMPLGLYVMVLMCKDEPGKTGEVEFGMEAVNMDTAKQISKWGLPKEHKDDILDQSTKIKLLRPIRMASGRTTAETMPLEISPLIYPGLEDMIERPQIKRDESFKNRLLRNKEFVADYFDRRARADYAGNNPDSALTKASATVPEFRNRFADPNHPCNNGHLFSLITGGNYVAQPRGRRSRLREVGEDGKLKPRVKQEIKIRGPISLAMYPVKKIMTPNVLYLTIVNLPTQEELDDARIQLGLDSKGIKEMLAEYAKAMGREKML